MPIPKGDELSNRDTSSHQVNPASAAGTQSDRSITSPNSRASIPTDSHSTASDRCVSTSGKRRATEAADDRPSGAEAAAACPAEVAEVDRDSAADQRAPLAEEAAHPGPGRRRLRFGGRDLGDRLN